jgi:hypothetical protein
LTKPRSSVRLCLFGQLAERGFRRMSLKSPWSRKARNYVS